jgi:ribonuclease III
MAGITVKAGKKSAPAPGPKALLLARLGLPPKSSTLLDQALNHPSAAQEAGLDRSASYERLEFLGDSLLNFAVADLLWERFPSISEGDLTKLRAHWVSGASLARVAAGLGVGEALALGAGEERTGGRSKARVLAAALEALVAAVYLDAGWMAARAMVRRLLEDPIASVGLGALEADCKTVLQEWRQSRAKTLPEYRCERSGDGFRCIILLDGEPFGEGVGRSRKSAEQAAAAAALRALEGMGVSR